VRNQGPIDGSQNGASVASPLVLSRMEGPDGCHGLRYVRLHGNADASTCGKRLVNLPAPLRRSALDTRSRHRRYQFGKKMA